MEIHVRSLILTSPDDADLYKKTVWLLIGQNGGGPGRQSEKMAPRNFHEPSGSSAVWIRLGDRRFRGGFA